MRKQALTAMLISSLLLTACSSRPATTPAAPPPPQEQPGAPPTPTPPNTNPTPTPEPPKPEPPKPEPPKPVRREIPKQVRGIHLSAWVAGTPGLLESLLDWCQKAGINTLVLEIKAEDGYLSWNSDIPLAIEIGANKNKVGDLTRLVAHLHERGFWVAGRIVVMNDKNLYRARPEWAIPGFDGQAYSFMNPQNENVWAYNLEIAKAAAAAGVDEIQWDYIRYPERQIAGFNADTTAEFRTAAINGFLKRSVEILRPMGVVVSADVFGLTTSVAEGDDMRIGQDYKQIAEIVDYISAMAYPSHYAPWTYGIPSPDHAPYETVKASLAKAIERTPGIPVEKHRPWIQDFTYPGPGALVYGATEVLGQVRALEELGIHSWILWDPSNKYSRDARFIKQN